MKANRCARHGTRWMADEDAVCALMPYGAGSQAVIFSFARLTGRSFNAVHTRRYDLRCRREAAARKAARVVP